MLLSDLALQQLYHTVDPQWSICIKFSCTAQKIQQIISRWCQRLQPVHSTLTKPQVYSCPNFYSYFFVIVFL